MKKESKSERGKGKIEYEGQGIKKVRPRGVKGKG